MQQLIDEINILQLECLEQDWVEAIFNSEFLEINDLPAPYETILNSFEIQETFTNIINALDRWQNSLSNEDKTWALLSQKINHKSLLALLYYFVDLGTKNILQSECRKNAIVAARVYFKLLSIPGYKAYHIFYSQLFTNTLACLSFPRLMFENDSHITEVNRIIKHLMPYAMELRGVVKSLQLHPANINFEHIMSNLVEITSGILKNHNGLDMTMFGTVCQSVNDIVDVLLRDPGGVVKTSAVLILFKSLLPKLLSASGGVKYSSLTRGSVLKYTQFLLIIYGENVIYSFVVLIEHVCHWPEGLERLEVRSARVLTVIGMMDLLPNPVLCNFIKWLLTLSRSSKSVHRQLTLEILAKLLNRPNNLDETEPPARESTSADQPSAATKTIREHSDQSTSTNGYTDDEHGHESPDQGINMEVDTDGANTSAPRPLVVSHVVLLHAVKDRVQDTSGNVRTRALLILADCVIADVERLRRAVQELNGTGPCGRLVSMAARCMSDERAAVRRAALLLLHRLMHTVHSNRNSTNLQVLVSLCRDASVIVRSGAIAALGELVPKWPEECVLNAFLTGPLHQLSDPEVKIQEQVINFVKQILIDGIKRYSNRNSSEDNLPWLFLTSISNHKMRRHLQKACTLLATNSNCINYNLIDTLSTHLRPSVPRTRALQCLVMLSSVGKHVDYSNVDFILNYYYHLTNDPTKPSDPRLLLLVLEMLSMWSRWLVGEKRTQLRAHLIIGLRNRNWSIEDGMTGSATLAAQLDPTDLLWATDLMNIFESSAVEGAEIAEWIRAANMSLVAPKPPSNALLNLFITALDDDNTELDGATLGCVVAGAGRLCIRSRNMAIATAPLLARLLLRTNAHITPRVNALLAITDICLRYCALLSDSDSDVREPAEYYVTSCLKPEMIYHHFVECVLHYNGCGPHAQPDCPTVNMSFDARQLTYDVMLQRLSLVQRLNVQCRLAREVLQHAADVCDEEDELPPSLKAALLDTITLLCGPRMKLPRRPVSNGDPGDIDDLTERVTTNIVSHKMKSTVAEVLVPAVLRLYARLRNTGEAVVGQLVRIANDLLKDYRQEIEELIEKDEELVGKIREFQETAGEETTFGNSRNLVTCNAPPDVDTPQLPAPPSLRRKYGRSPRGGPPPKRLLRM